MEIKDVRDVIDFSGERIPLVWIMQWLLNWKVKLYKDKKQKSWARRIKTVGTIEKDGWFYPDAGQIIKYRIKVM